MIYAAGNGNAASVQALLDAGIDAKVRYANDVTALMWAAAYGKLDSVKLLIARGADVDAKDNRGKTALTIAIEEKQGAVVDALRAAGARE
jgi:ankyrin repeat protein